MNKRVGIYLGYRPNQDVRVQGIGRLIGFIVAGMTECGRPPAIAIAHWGVAELRELLRDVGLEESDIEVISTRGNPALLAIRNLVNRIRRASHRGSRNRPALRSRIHGAIASLGAYVMSQTNPPAFLVSAILCAPLILLLGLAELALRVLSVPLKVLGWLERLWAMSSKDVKELKSRFLRLMVRSLKALKGSIKDQSFSYLIYDRVMARVKKRLVKRINSAGDVTAWLVPGIFWSEVEDIRARVVVTVPDLVYCEFPSRFLEPQWEKLDDVVRRVTSRADAVVSYSSYVRDRHLTEYLGLDPSRSHFVPHAPIDMSANLVPQGLTLSPQELRGRAEEVLREYQSSLRRGGYLTNFDLSGARFLIYPSQYRPHKNMLNLARAIERLIRSDFVDIKLALTTHPGGENELTEYVRKNRLGYDVLFFNNVEPDVLAALNALAVCSVNPTLFEGGFPFTFSEAFSVGTPSIMGNIGVVTSEIVDAELRKHMLFDPYDVDSIAERIRWAIDNRDVLYDMQMPLYKRMLERTWTDVAREYLAILDARA